MERQVILEDIFMEKSMLLKWLLLIGGYFELIVGVIFIFMHLFIESFGVPAGVPMFSQLSGLFFICFGILLLYSAKDLEKYIVIIKVNILFRFLVQPFVIYNSILFPDFGLLLIITSLYDLVWSILMIVLLRQCGYLWSKSE